MKVTTKTLFAALMLFTIACKKESSTIQSSGTEESATQTLSSDASELVGANAVKIGTQVWKRKNLDVTHYRNGDRIQQVTDQARWAKLKTGAWCWYNNDSANCAVYGKLYNWYAVNDPRGLAPTGWHVPSDAEWDTLSVHLGNNAGGKMKSTGTIEDGTGLWHAPNRRATNRSGFTGLPGGFREYDGTFFSLGNDGFWWSSTQGSTAGAWDRSLYYFGGDIERSFRLKQSGFSVRCLRD